MAKIFVWLRYSSSRQLTWQRNYNTQPRILGEAQARLTNAIAQVGYLMYLMHSKDRGQGTCLPYNMQPCILDEAQVRLTNASVPVRIACEKQCRI